MLFPPCSAVSGSLPACACGCMCHFCVCVCCGAAPVPYRHDGGGGVEGRGPTHPTAPPFSSTFLPSTLDDTTGTNACDKTFGSHFTSSANAPRRARSCAVSPHDARQVRHAVKALGGVQVRRAAREGARGYKPRRRRNAGWASRCRAARVCHSCTHQQNAKPVMNPAPR